jgi:hypothetical protein
LNLYPQCPARGLYLFEDERRVRIGRIPKQRAANYVDKILKGTKPGEIPIEQSTKFHLLTTLPARRA